MISLVCAKYGAKVVCCDINPIAVNLTKGNYIENESILKGFIEVRYGDLFSVLRENEKFDVIIFNPPYLPIKKNDLILKKDWIDVATNGGLDGLKLIKRYLKDIGRFLSKNGCAYFIFSSFSNRDKLNKYLKKNKLNSKIASSCKYEDEIIDVYQICVIE